MKDTDKTKYIMYTRKSTDREDRQVLSLESQIDALKDIADKRNLEIVQIIQESRSAKKPLSRPEYQTMLENIRLGKAQGILVWSPDRLSRNPIDGANLTQLLDEGILERIITPSQDFPNEPMSKMMLGFFMINAKFENDVKGVNVKRGLKKKLEMGWYPFVAPQGYMNTPDREKGYKIITVNHKRFLLVRKMWDLALAGTNTVPEIAKIADEEWNYTSIKRKRIGGKAISRSGLYDLLSNPFYYGKFEVNGVWYDGKHKPMVTKEEFDKVQQLLGRTDKKRPQNHDFPFTGMIKCGECDCSITAEHREKYFARTKRLAIYDYYQCTKKSRKIKCKQKAITAKKLESQILEILGKIEIHEDFKKWTIKYLKEAHRRESESRGQINSNFRSEEESIKEKLDKLLDLKLDGHISDTEYCEKKERLQSDLNKCQEKLTDSNYQQKNWIDNVEDAFDLAQNVTSKFKTGTLRDKRDILNYVGSNFILKDKKISFNLKNPFFILKNASDGKYKEKERLEPVELVDITTKAGFSAPADPSWLRGLDSNQQP